MPEFALFDLANIGEDHTLSHLISSSETVPGDILLPSAQSVSPSTTQLTWFQVVSYTYSLLTGCFWPYSHTSLSTTHTLTGSLHTRYLAMAEFLNRHLPLFPSSLLTPSLPPSLLADSPNSHKAPPLSHLRAGENEVGVVWYTPSPNSHLHKHIVTSLSKTGDVVEGSHDAGGGSHDQDDIILGVFGFNHKSVRPPQPGVTPSVEVHTVCVSSSHLAQLRETWRELAEAARSYLDDRLSGRPISRSPSRLRKQAEKSQQVQANLQVCVYTSIHAHTHNNNNNNNCL